MTFSLIILKIATCILIVFVSRLFYPFILKRQISVNVVRRFRLREHFPKPPLLVASVRVKNLNPQGKTTRGGPFLAFSGFPARSRIFSQGVI